MIKVELNHEAVGELLKSSEMQELVKSYADEIAERAGEGYASDTYNAGSRVIASAYTETEEAMEDNLENNTLLMAVGND